MTRYLAATLLAFGLLAAACAGDSTPRLPDTIPDAIRSAVSIDRTTGVIADGADVARITVVVRDARGMAIPGLYVDVDATGVGNVIEPPAGPTDAGGAATATLASTVAERKTVTITVQGGAGAVVLSDQPTVEFTRAALPPVRLAFVVQPADTTVAAALAPAVQVAVHDVDGHLVTTAQPAITVALAGGTAGAALGGTTTVTAVAGVATFVTLTVDQVGTGFALTATADEGLDGATSDPFDVGPGAAARLVFVAQPPEGVAGVPLAPPVQVEVRDLVGNPITTATAAITLALASNPPGGTLAGTVTVAAAGGLATFADLRLDRAGTGYTLIATAAQLQSATSTPFAVAAGAAARLRLAGLADPSTAGAAQALTVTAEDAFGNVAPSYRGTVYFSSSDGAATLPAAQAFTATDAGVRVFAGGVTLRTAGAGVTVTATDTVAAGVTGAVAVAVVPGAAAALEFTQPPTAVVAGTPITPAVRVTIRDACGNTVPATSAVNVALGQNPGGATLAGTTTAVAVAGVAAFGTLSLDRAAAGYTLTAALDQLAQESGAFTVSPAATARLVVGGLPDPWTAGDARSLTVTAHDALGNPTPAYRGTVHFAATDPQALLPVDYAFTAGDAGARVFAGVTLKTAGTRAIAATDTVTAAVTGSQAVTVVPAAAATLAFATQPPTAAVNAALAPAPTVAVRDAYGNLVVGYVGDVGVTLLPGTPPGGTLHGTAGLGVANGQAAFADLAVDATGAGYRLRAQSGGLPPVDSAPFDVYALPVAGDLLVTEVMHSPTGGAPLRQWLELRNLSPRLLRLEGVTVTDTLAVPARAFTIDATRLVPAGGTYLLGASANPAENGGIGGVDFAWPGSFGLGTAGALELARGATVVHTFGYDAAAYPHTTGRAMNLSTIAMGPGGDQHPWHWCDAAAPWAAGDYGTPGAANADCGWTVSPTIAWCALQWPDDIPQVGPPAVPALVVGGAQAVYARFYEPNVTTINQAGNDRFPFVVAQLGYGPTTDPAGWTWIDAGYTPDADYHGGASPTLGFEPNNDEVTAALTVAAAGSYRYGYRLGQRDAASGQVVSWTYCGRAGVVDNGDPTSREDYGALTAEWPACAPSPVVISQLYPGGGGASGVYRYDYVELHNRSASAQSLAGWSLQYASATAGSTPWVVGLLTGTIPPGGYYLLQVGVEGGGGGYPPAAPDQIFAALGLGANGGRVALVRSTTALTGCPALPDGVVADLVGYGNATCAEGAPAAAPALSQTLQRAGSACTDTDANVTDLAPATPALRNTTSAANHCGCD